MEDASCKYARRILSQRPGLSLKVHACGTSCKMFVARGCSIVAPLHSHRLCEVATRPNWTLRVSFPVRIYLSLSKSRCSCRKYTPVGTENFAWGRSPSHSEFIHENAFVPSIVQTDGELLLEEAWSSSRLSVVVFAPNEEP